VSINPAYIFINLAFLVLAATVTPWFALAGVVYAILGAALSLSR